MRPSAGFVRWVHNQLILIIEENIIKTHIKLGLLAFTFSLAACNNNSSDSGDSPVVPAANSAFRVVNAIADSTMLAGSFEDSVGTYTQMPAFGTAGNVEPFPAGSYVVQLAANSSSGATQNFSINNVLLDAGSLTSVIAAGSLTSGTQTGFTAEESLTSAAVGQAVMQVANAASQAYSGQTFQFVFTPIAGASGAATVQSSAVTFAQAGTPFNLPAGKYEITVDSSPTCSPGQACSNVIAVVFDSGPNGVDLQDSSGGTGAGIYQLIALDATSAQASADSASITLLLLGTNSGSYTTLFNRQN
jgi:hypothetical protein